MKQEERDMLNVDLLETERMLAEALDDEPGSHAYCYKLECRIKFIKAALASIPADKGADEAAIIKAFVERVHRRADMNILVNADTNDTKLIAMRNILEELKETLSAPQQADKGRGKLVEAVEKFMNGCGNHGCKVKVPVGMGTNGPCTCRDRVAELIVPAIAALNSVGT